MYICDMWHVIGDTQIWVKKWPIAFLIMSILHSQYFVAKIPLKHWLPFSVSVSSLLSSLGLQSMYIGTKFLLNWAKHGFLSVSTSWYHTHKHIEIKLSEYERARNLAKLNLDGYCHSHYENTFFIWKQWSM